MNVHENDVFYVKGDVATYYQKHVEEALPLYNSDEFALVRSYLTDQKFTAKDISEKVSYRLINHWISKGLLPQANKSAWIKLSKIDLIWIKIALSLRHFGFPLKKILMVRRQLLSNGSLYLHIYTLFGLLKRSVGLMIYSDADCMLLLDLEYNLIQNNPNNASHLYINLNPFIKEICSELYQDPLYGLSPRPTPQELLLLFFLKENKYTEVTIKYLDGKRILIEGKETLAVHEEISKVLAQHKYQNISLTLDNGKIIKVHRTVKRQI